MAKVIGVDLGTTNTVVAVMDGAKPRIIENREGRSEMRSVVSIKNRKDPRTGIEDREELVGQVAEDNAALEPANTIVSVKRLMGRAADDSEIERVRQRYAYRLVEPADGTKDSIRVLLDGVAHSPVEISAKILRRAKEDAERACGGEVKYAVITVPAYFSEAQRDATKKAGTKAGLTVVKLLDEPTAAAVAFGMDAQEQRVKTVLVYDLGGGTLDISVLMMAGSVFAPLALQGDMWLGGDDFDQQLIEVALAHLKDDFGIDARRNERFLVELRKAARATKERLSANASAALIVPGLLRDAHQNWIDLSLEVTREQFEGWIRPLVDRTVELTRQAIRDANLTPERIDCVLLAGNASRMPLIQQQMEKLFGADKILRNVSPKHSVALGAAIVAARLGERIVCQAPDPLRVQAECGHVNRPEATHCERPRCGALLPVPGEQDLLFTSAVAPFHYGAQTVEDRFALFVRKGDPYPTEQPRTQVFGTSRPNQRIVTVPVYGGESLERASANLKQGEAVAILPPGLPKGTAIAISLWLDSEGLFALSARLADGTDLQALKTKGEADAKAIAILLEVEQLITARVAELGSVLRDLERSVSRVFEQLRAGRPREALQEAERVRAELDDHLHGGDADERSRRSSLLDYCEWIAQRYRWVDAPAMDAFANVVRDTREVLTSRIGVRGQDKRKLADLEQAWGALPERVLQFVNCRQAIWTRIRPVDLSTASLLERDLDGLEQAFKGGNAMAGAWWTGFMKRVNQALERVEKERAPGLRCVRGHEVQPGHRYCPVEGCGADLTGLIQKPVGSPADLPPVS